MKLEPETTTDWPAPPLDGVRDDTTPTPPTAWPGAVVVVDRLAPCPRAADRELGGEPCEPEGEPVGLGVGCWLAPREKASAMAATSTTAPTAATESFSRRSRLSSSRGRRPSPALAGGPPCARSRHARRPLIRPSSAGEPARASGGVTATGTWAVRGPASRARRAASAIAPRARWPGMTTAWVSPSVPTRSVPRGPLTLIRLTSSPSSGHLSTSENSIPSRAVRNPPAFAQGNPGSGASLH